MSGRPRVLVADDHRAMLDSLVRLLSGEFEVVAAVSDGLSAVTTAAQLEPDLLVLDIAMPGLNGIAAAARVKESGSTAKVVFVTNLHDREFVQESLALGEVGFVVKDRLVADLLPAIRTVLAGRSSSRRRSRSKRPSCPFPGRTAVISSSRPHRIGAPYDARSQARYRRARRSGAGRSPRARRRSRRTPRSRAEASDVDASG